MKSGSYIHGITDEQVAALRELAETLGYHVSRGPGTGQGSLAGLLRDVADRYQADPHEVTFQVAKAVHRAYAMPEKYRKEKTMNDGYCPRPLTAQGLIDTAAAVLASNRGDALNEAWARWLQHEAEYVRDGSPGWQERRQQLAELAATAGIEL